MQRNPEEISLKEEIGKKLIAIADNVSYQDKLDFCEATEYGISTVYNYLNGHVTNIDVAMKMLDFFKRKIMEKAGIINA